jgi:hypothetical protein
LKGSKEREGLRLQTAYKEFDAALKEYLKKDA